MHGLEETGARQLRQAARIIAVGLVGRKRLQRLIGLPALDADRGHAALDEPVIKHRGHPAGLEYDALTRRRFHERRVDIGRCGSNLGLVDETPSLSMTQMCVSSIETSSPA